MSCYKGLLVLTAAVALSACSGDSKSASSGTAAGRAGGGDSFRSTGGRDVPESDYSKWFTEYNKLHPNIQINYQSQGSGARDPPADQQTVFFGATDRPMTDEQLKAAPGHDAAPADGPRAPSCPSTTCPASRSELKFSGPVLADIVLGKITKWNDPALAKLNPGVEAAGHDITFVHRSDGSGTTFIWVDYLSKVSPEFKKKVGVNTSVNWPVGVGGKGNEGVAGPRARRRRARSATSS